MYYSTKKYDHNVGLSCCFRQWRADSHCHFLHGYPLAFRFVFKAETLDDRNWVQDFGALKPLKTYLETVFDHKTLVASDDPNIEWYKEGQRLGTMNLVIVGGVGCEMVAEAAFNQARSMLVAQGQYPRVDVHLVEVSEHSGNSAIYMDE